LAAKRKPAPKKRSGTKSDAKSAQGRRGPSNQQEIPRHPRQAPLRGPVSQKKIASPKRPPSTATKKPPVRKAVELDLSDLPSELVTHETRHLCLACVLNVMTRHLGLPAKKAQMEIKAYSPSLEELRSKVLSRPFFSRQNESDPCPYCGSASKWHAGLAIYRIENTKSTEVKRRALLKSLAKNSFAVIEEKATQQTAFFQWIEKISAGINLDDPRWLHEVSRYYLGRKEPKTDWTAQFSQVHSIRRSRLLESGWEIDHGRLFLAPMLFDELLLVQYLVSRAHRAGGLTFEGRYTLPELFGRLRNSGYLRAAGVVAHHPSDALEQLVTYLGGGDTSLRLYYIVDRRDLLEHLKALEDLRVPKEKPMERLKVGRTA
jgi:hypothetical protein